MAVLSKGPLDQRDFRTRELAPASTAQIPSVSSCRCRGGKRSESRSGKRSARSVDMDPSNPRRSSAARELAAGLERGDHGTTIPGFQHTPQPDDAPSAEAEQFRL